MCDPSRKEYTRDVMVNEDRGPEDGLSELPLFPLNMVLFPGAPLPLHIFEERYKSMIGNCMERNEPFGVVLIKQGLESGAPALPFETGTTARVLRSELLDEGRMNIMTKGERRFEIGEITQQAPYLVGRVRFLGEPLGEGITELVPQLKEEYPALVQGLTALAGGYASQVTIPDDPVELSYTVAASLNLQNTVRQALLEAPTVAARLSHLVPLLKRGNYELQQEIAKRNPYRGPRLN